MKVSELKERKRELGYTNEKVAELSGVPLSTVQKVFGGTTGSPRLETLRALERALFPENGRIFGAPDFVLEVLSPSARQRDLLTKLNEYWQAGVREYWIVDPAAQTVTVYSFDPGIPPAVYSFSGSVPIGIWGGRPGIDFSGMQSIREDFSGADSK